MINKIRPEGLLGLPKQNIATQVRLVDAGLPFDTILSLHQASGFSVNTLADGIGLSTGKLYRRRKKNRLTSLESDRLFSLAFAIARSIELFGGEVCRARVWMITPSPALGNVAPINMARSEVGRWELNNLIGRLEHGVFT